MQIKYTRHFGEELSREQLDGIIDHLDEHLFLHNDRFIQARQNTEERFHQASVRDAAHAGTAYAGNAEDLHQQLEAFYVASGGPGSESTPSSGDQVKGIIAPHIDFHRGGPCYTWAYRELASSIDADLFIILGIGHSGPRRLFTMTSKDFSTPFGTIQTDRDFVHQVQALCPFDIFEDEFLHKHEHSIEFQVVFLQSILRDRPDAMIVPILCGSFHNLVMSGTSPSKNAEYMGFVEALQQTIKTSGKRVCYIAGVDLSHIGMRFGDQDTLTDEWLNQVRTDDLELLSHVECLDPEALFQHICEDQDQRRVCGYPAIYTLMHLAGAQKSQLLKYDQAADTMTQQAVTFASMVLR